MASSNTDDRRILIFPACIVGLSGGSHTNPYKQDKYLPGDMGGGGIMRKVIKR